MSEDRGLLTTENVIKGALAVGIAYGITKFVNAGGRLAAMLMIVIMAVLVMAGFTIFWLPVEHCTWFEFGVFLFVYAVIFTSAALAYAVVLVVVAGVLAIVCSILGAFGRFLAGIFDFIIFIATTLILTTVVMGAPIYCTMHQQEIIELVQPGPDNSN